MTWNVKSIIKFLGRESWDMSVKVTTLTVHTNHVDILQVCVCIMLVYTSIHVSISVSEWQTCVRVLIQEYQTAHVAEGKTHVCGQGTGEKRWTDRQLFQDILWLIFIHPEAITFISIYSYLIFSIEFHLPSYLNK